MESWRKDSRKEPVITDLDALVPKDHLLRKIEKVMDYDWLYERLEPYYCHDNGRPGTDPVLLIKMVLIQHLYGIPSLRQTYQRIQDTLSYRWFLGYGLLDEIPHFATVSYAFCKRFPEELSSEIFEHILNKALNNRMVDPSIVFIDGTHIKASANKKKFQKGRVAQAAKIYSEQLRQEVNAEREKLGKGPIEDGDDGDGTKGGGAKEQTVSTTDPDSGMFVKGEHERQFAYEAHTACDKRGYVLGVEVTAGNVHDSVVWDGIYDKISKLTTHIWQEYLDLVEALRKTERGKEIYAMRKETIERVFADAKEKHAMRYTHHRGLAAVTRWVRLKYAAMNLERWQYGVGTTPFSPTFSQFLTPYMPNPRSSIPENRGSLTGWRRAGVSPALCEYRVI